MQNWIQFAWKLYKLRPELAFSAPVLPVAELSEVQTAQHQMPLDNSLVWLGDNFRPGSEGQALLN